MSGNEKPISSIPPSRYKVFAFKKGQWWDGDESIIHWLEDKLLDTTKRPLPQIRRDFKVTVIVEFE